MADAEVTGVITELGVFVVTYRDAGSTLGFHLKPWRLKGGDLNFTELRVTKLMSESDIAKVKNKIGALSVVSVVVSDLENYYEDKQKTVLKQITDSSVGSSEFNEIVNKLRQPVEFVHPSLGRFLLDRRLEIFEGEYEHEGNKFTVCLDSRNDAPLAEQLVILESILGDIKNYDVKARRFAAEKLLAIKNDSWVEGVAETVSESQFMERMTLNTVSITLKKKIIFFYGDGDLFYGHSIYASGFFEEGFNDAGF